MVFVLTGAESAVEYYPVKDFYNIQECEEGAMVPMLCTSIQLLGRLCRLLGLMKRLTAVLMFGLGAAYLWPYAAEHLFKK